jgi:hypothetical protein
MACCRLFVSLHYQHTNRKQTMNIANKIANRFNTTEDALLFDEASYFAFDRSCTVRVCGVWFDVWFDASYNITNSAESQ